MPKDEPVIIDGGVVKVWDEDTQQYVEVVVVGPVRPARVRDLDDPRLDP
jgi:hypothetical protein